MPDGDHQYEGRVVPCRDNEVLVVVRDVTQRKRSERALIDAQANLLRLSRLTALGEFTASIAHEIRQPLTVILLNARTCLRWLSGRTPNLTEISAALTDVVEAGQRANEIIRRNRELFKHGTVQKAPLDLNAVISEVEALAQSRLSAARVTLVTSVPPDIPAVQGDRVELQQVLLNLIGNSIEAMDGAESSARRIEIVGLSPQGHVPCRAGHRCGTHGAIARACLVHDEALRQRYWALDQPLDYRSTRRSALGRGEHRAWRDLRLHPSRPFNCRRDLASPRQRQGRAYRALVRI